MIEKLRKIQQNLKAPKNQINKFGGYNYRSCEDIFEAVKPLLEEEKLALIMNDELVQIGDRYYIKATATLIDEFDKTISNTAYAREEETKKGMDGSQITGASSSYARKYALNGLFLIDDVKDSDTTNVGNSNIEPTEDDACEWTFQFGKYKGNTMKEMIAEDEQYVEWFIKNKANDFDKKCFELLTGVKLPTEEELKKTGELLLKINKLMVEKKILPNEIVDYFGKKSNEMSDEELEEVIMWLEVK